MKQKSFFILVNIWTCYCWFLIINVSLVSFCFFGNLLEDHFDKSISTILGPIGQLIWLSSEIVQTDTKPHHTLDFLRFWGILTRHLQIQGGGGGALTRKFKCKNWPTRQAVYAKSAEGSFSSYSSADRDDDDCHPSLKIWHDKKTNKQNCVFCYLKKKGWVSVVHQQWRIQAKSVTRMGVVR